MYSNLSLNKQKKLMCYLRISLYFLYKGLCRKEKFNSQIKLIWQFFTNSNSMSVKAAV